MSIVDHTSTDELVLQWRFKSDPGVPEREWQDTSIREPRHHGAQAKQTEALLTRPIRHRWEDREWRVVNRITHVTDSWAEE